MRAGARRGVLGGRHAGGGPSSGTTSSRVASGLDDAEERVSDGDMYFDSSDLELIDDSEADRS